MTEMHHITRYECPVDGCGWHLDEHQPELTGRLLPGVDLVDAVGRSVYELRRQVLTGVETALGEHLASHATRDYVATIARLRAQLAAERGPDA